MAGEYASVVTDVRKVVAPEREMLRGIWLALLHGAKIGVFGPERSPGCRGPDGYR